MDINELQKIVVAFRDERNWKQFHNIKDCALSLSLEAAEVLELTQWKNGEELDRATIEHKEDFADELSDVLYWVLLMSDQLNIDIAEAFQAKLKKTALKYPVSKSYGQNKKYTEL